MSADERLLASHLARRAGFGATPEEIDRYVDIGYEAAVEELLDPANVPDDDYDELYRRFPELHSSIGPDAPVPWMYRMMTSGSPLREKVALFWHGVFATSNVKLNNPLALLTQIDMFREFGMGRFDDLLVQLSKDPAMLIWLDNHTNHKDAVNENYGREILELFSLGVGNYTEADVKECARAFTGWTVRNAEYMSLMAESDSIWPFSRIAWHYEYRDDDHDAGEKSFLGERGDFDGQDVIEIICRQQATAQFICRHLYNFFVADEVPVPQWGDIPPRDPAAIDALTQAYVESRHDIRSVLRVLFNADFFKESRFQRVKSPVELVVGILRTTGEFESPESGLTVDAAVNEAGFMGQQLLTPPSVEGWHTGDEWITSGAIVDRVNFAAKHLSDLSVPGVREIVDRLVEEVGDAKAPEGIIDACLEAIGSIEVSDDTRDSLTESVKGQWDESHVVDVLKMIASSREYQRC